MILPIIAVYGRKETTQLLINHLNGIGIKPLIIYSRPCDVPKGDFFHHHAKNEPLGNKWQSGIDYAMSLKADFYQILGSDDFPSYRYYERFEFALKQSPEIQFYGVEDMHLINLKNRRLYWFKYPDSRKFKKGFATLGAGRIYSHRLLGIINPIFDKHLSSGLDEQGEIKARELIFGSESFRIEPTDQDFIGLLNPKTDNSMHPMEFFKGKIYHMTQPSILYDFYDLELIQEMLRLPNKPYEGVISEKLKTARIKRGL